MENNILCKIFLRKNIYKHFNESQSLNFNPLKKLKSRYI